MKRYTLAEFVDGLDQVGITAGDVVMVHSALYRLGRLDRHNIEAIPGTLAEALLEHLGPEGTVAVPIFNYEGLEFFKNYRARQMGPFSGYIAARPQSRRTFHTVFAIAAAGRLAEDVAARDALSAFGPDGPFEFLLEQGAKTLLLGAGISAASVIHLAEETVGVPYRYWMEFPSERPLPEGREELVPYKMYVRNLEKYPRLYLGQVEQWLRRDGAIRETRLGGGPMTAFSFSDYMNSVASRLKQDPEALIRE